MLNILYFKKLTKLMLILLCLAIYNNCTDIVRPDDILSIPQRHYLGNDLRLDGYYYRELNGYLKVYFLYHDGSILYGSTFPVNELEKQKAQYRSVEWQNQVKKLKHRWGLFNIDGSNILFERWYPSEPPLKVLTREGEILNDSTSVINNFYKVENGSKIFLEELNEIYHFKGFSLKPDSTNVFVY